MCETIKLIHKHLNKISFNEKKNNAKNFKIFFFLGGGGGGTLVRLPVSWATVLYIKYLWMHI